MCTSKPGATTYDVKLSYNGVNYWTKATGLTATNMLWTIPNVNTTGAMIKVIFRNGGAWVGADSSDLPFTITQQ
jgi:hypothetical protein